MKLTISKTLKRNIILTVISILVLAMIFWVLFGLFLFRTNQEVLVTIKNRSSSREIASQLKDRKVITSSLLFEGFIYAHHLILQNGIYKIEPGMNLIQIVSMIHSGKVDEYLITIPEGWRASQIDELLSQKGIIKKGDFTQIASGEEGYLFPDTYRIPINATPQLIENIMLDNFKKKTTGLKINAQTIIIASIVEREAKLDNDRPIIASVYLNRLAIGMKLQSDPTIQYGKGDWLPITQSDYKNFQSLYNTYLYTGLPPTAICNPGLKSILAVVSPAKTNYYYFFSKSDGAAVFSQTYAEHLANLQKYARYRANIQ